MRISCLMPPEIIPGVEIANILHQILHPFHTIGNFTSFHFSTQQVTQYPPEIFSHSRPLNELFFFMMIPFSKKLLLFGYAQGREIKENRHDDHEHNHREDHVPFIPTGT
jgi:hypothetical protein